MPLAVDQQVGHVARLPQMLHLAPEALPHKRVGDGPCTPGVLAEQVGRCNNRAAPCSMEAWRRRCFHGGRQAATLSPCCCCCCPARTFHTAAVPHGTEAGQQRMHLWPPVLLQLAAHAVNQPLRGRREGCGGCVGQAMQPGSAQAASPSSSPHPHLQVSCVQREVHLGCRTHGISLQAGQG